MKIYIAPMAGVTDYAFRKILLELGVDFCFTEMINVNLLLENNKKTYSSLLKISDFNKEGTQIFGNNLKDIEKGFNILNEYGFKKININMGCPQNKIVKKGAGSALLLRYDEIENMIQNIENKEKLSLKIRIGYKEFNDPYKYVELASKYNLDFVAIHCRTKENMFFDISYDILNEISYKTRNTKLIGNGNIFNLDDVKIYNSMNLDGIMLARGVINNPFLVSDILKGYETKKSIKDYSNLLIKQITYMLEDKEEGQVVREINKFIENYYNKFNISHSKLLEIMTCFSINKKIDLINKLN